MQPWTVVALFPIPTRSSGMLSVFFASLFQSLFIPYLIRVVFPDSVEMVDSPVGSDGLTACQRDCLEALGSGKCITQFVLDRERELWKRVRIVPRAHRGAGSFRPAWHSPANRLRGRPASGRFSLSNMVVFFACFSYPLLFYCSYGISFSAYGWDLRNWKTG